jgi:hypothetical protein
MAPTSTVPMLRFQAMPCYTPFRRLTPKRCSLHPRRAVFARLSRSGVYTRISVGAPMFASPSPVLLHVVRVIPPPICLAVPTGVLVFRIGGQFLPVIICAAVPLTLVGTASSLVGVKSRCLEFLLTILTDLCFHGNSVREFSRYCRNARFAVVGRRARATMVQTHPGCTEM